jgi:predicted RNase H-like HicB family nuclease
MAAKGKKMATRSFTVVYEVAEEGGFYAHIPALDLTTEGETLAKAKTMARDAIKGYLEAAKLLGRTVPSDVTVERIEINA